MLIGALIGMVISLTLTFIRYSQVAAEAHKHNNSVLAGPNGKITITVYYFPIVLRTTLFALIGAIIGYFI